MKGQAEPTVAGSFTIRALFEGGGLLGAVVAVLGISAGLVLDGGSLRQILQPTAALIVLGGTVGAVLIQFPLPTVLRALRSLGTLVVGEPDQSRLMIEELCRHAASARRLGLLSLDTELDAVDNPFLRACLMHAVDGVRPAELQAMMEVHLQSELDKDDELAGVFEAAGGFAPTMGILGAVIGLIQVMQRLSNIEEVGKGIAVAFVATLYGVGVANLLFLPCAGRLRAQLERRRLLREMMLEGVLAIMEKNTPRAVERRLLCFLPASSNESRLRPVAL